MRHYKPAIVVDSTLGSTAEATVAIEWRIDSTAFVAAAVVAFEVDSVVFVVAENFEEMAVAAIVAANYYLYLYHFGRPVAVAIALPHEIARRLDLFAVAAAVAANEKPIFSKNFSEAAHLFR